LHDATTLHFDLRIAESDKISLRVQSSDTARPHDFQFRSVKALTLGGDLVLLEG